MVEKLKTVEQVRSKPAFIERSISVLKELQRRVRAHQEEENVELAAKTRERLHKSNKYYNSFAKEIAQVSKHPGIAFTGPEQRRRAWLVGTPFDVWQIVEAYKVMGRDRLLAEGDLSEKHVQLILGYYEDYPEEIDQAIEENLSAEDQWRAKRPDLFSTAE